MLGAPTESVDERDLSELSDAGLSPHFSEFLPYFALEARRCGGEARVGREDGRLVGLWLTDPTERVASIFSRSATWAEAQFRERGPFATFCERRFETMAEPYGVYARELSSGTPARPFRHSVRPVESRDLPAVRDLAREVHGPVNVRWFEGLDQLPEVGLLAEVGGRLAGVGWLSLVDRHARLHSLAVRPPFRRLGVGGDLVAARILYAGRSGAVDVLSEIAERSVGSSVLAERAGMRRVGEIFFYPPSR